MFATNGGQALHFDTISLNVTGRTYELRVEFGDSSGEGRPSGVGVSWNGDEVVWDALLQGGASERRRAVMPFSENVMRVRVTGDSGDFVRITLISIEDGSLMLYGPQSYTAPTNLSRDSFPLPPGVQPPYRVYIQSGELDGSLRLTSGHVRLNGVDLLLPIHFDAIRGAVFEVSLNSANEIRSRAIAPDGGRLTVWVTGTDGEPPLLTVDAPVDLTLTSDSVVQATGTVQDASPVDLRINGELVALGSNGEFSVPLQLTTEGETTFAFVARDAAGNTTAVERRVVRDTTPPVLQVTAPPETFATRDDSILVSGFASDPNGVTVQANAYPLLLGPQGDFAAQLPLSLGQNPIVVAATDGAGNQASVLLMVTRDTTPPALTVTTPLNGAVVETDTVTVSGSVVDETSVSLTVNGAPVQIDAGGGFSAVASLVPGPNSIVVRAEDAAGNIAQIERSVTQSGSDPDLPPDPSTVAPPLDPTVAMNFAEATSFLYNGSNPIQRDADLQAFAPVRASVLRGRVLTRDGAPLSGARVSIKDHPEFGWTLSRADGMYDLAVNGGGALTVDFSKSGYLRAQRHVSASWQRYARVDDVALVQLDPAVTAVDLSDPDLQVARGSIVTDSDGSRQATMLFRPGTQAELVLPNDSVLAVTTLSIRATEYTVGPNGIKAMPAPLPAATAYTYAVELSADEAIAADATSVRFSQPVAFYLENFLELPVGTAVPVGYYDHGRGAWVPEEDGVIVKIVSVDSGRATLDFDGDDSGEADQDHTAFGITEAERVQLAQLYQVGQTLWRASTSHFTPLDLNFPVTWYDSWDTEMNGPANFGDDATNPDTDAEKGGGDGEDDPNCEEGSVVECENQVLGEKIALAGTPFSLTYRSNRSGGYTAGQTIRIPLSSDSVPPSLEKIYLRVEVAGVLHEDSFPALPNQTYAFTWDGRDAYGRAVQGRRPIQIDIGYVYPAFYNTYTLACREGVGGGFGSIIRCEQSGAYPSRGPAPKWQQRTIEVTAPTALEIWDASLQGLGGWSIDVHHTYDPQGRVLSSGGGRRRTGQGRNPAITTTAGLGGSGYSGDGGPAVQAELFWPAALAIAPDGTYYFADWNNHSVRRVDNNGIITTVAGTGVRGFSPDGTTATAARLDSPRGLALGPDGTLYISEDGNNRIRSVAADGILRTVAGSGDWGFAGDGGPALDAQFQGPMGIAVGADGSIYIADTFSNHRIRRVGPDGIISTIAGLIDGSTGESAAGYTPDGLSARGSRLREPANIALGPDGSVYFTEAGNSLVRRITPDGLLETVAGGGSCSPAEHPCDGRDATEAVLNYPWGIGLGGDGSIYITDWFDHRVRRVGPDGIITTFAGGAPSGSPPGDGGPATAARVASPLAVTLAPDGSVYIAESGTHRIRRVISPLPGFTNGDIALATEDGTEFHRFDPNGRHLSTVDAFTGTDKYVFAYDSAGRLASITDVDGLTTTIERDASGTATAVVGHYGHRTELTVGTGGLLTHVSAPGGETVTLGYATGGLLTSFTDQRHNTSTIGYAADGRLLSNANAASGSLALTRTETALGTVSTVTTAMGRVTSYTSDRTPNGDRVRQTTDARGLVTRTTRGLDGTVSSLAADSTAVTIRSVANARFGMQAPLVGEARIKTPSGLESVFTSSRRVTLDNPAVPLSALLSQVDSLVVNGRVYTTTYDGVTRIAVSQTPEGRQSTTARDARGRLTQSQIAGITATTYSYDTDGRLAAVSQGARTTTFSYGTDGLLASVTDPLSRTSSFFYDSAARITRQVLPDQREILYAYDAAGNLISLTPPSRPAHTFAYTPVNLTERYTPPDLGSGNTATEYSYNADRQLTRVERPDSLSIDLAYDTAGRLASVTLPNGVVGYGYSATTGLLTTLTAPGGVGLAYTYDGSLPTGVTWSGPVAGSIGVTYNNDFQITQQTVNGSNAVTFGYDGDGLLTAAGSLVLTRNVQNGLLSGSTLGNSTSALGYSGFGELASLSYALGATPQFQTSYVRDDLGRITQLTETVLGVTSVHTYDYDAVGRLVQVLRDSVPVEVYTYDDNGNRLSFTGPGGVVTGTYDAQDRLLTYGSSTYSYTLNGELTSKVTASDTTSYVYDVLGNLRSVTLPDSTTIEYIIDGEGRRIGRRVNGALVQGLLYDGQLTPVAELDSAGNVVSRFVYATRVNVPEYMVKGGATYRLVTDHLGSVRLVVNASTGAVAQRIDYDAFGRVTQNTAPGFQPFGFAGGLYDDATRLVRFGARDYDAETGRWMAKDPILFGGGSSNLYAYALEDPVNVLDPDGLQGLIGAGIGGGIDLGIQLWQNGWQLSCVNWWRVGGAAALGALGAGLGPTGSILGRGGRRAAQFGYDNSPGIINRGAVRLGWSGPKNGRDVLSLRVGSTHYDIPGIGVQSGANRVRDGAVGGAAGGALNQAFWESGACGC